jgi:type I restriction enzyme S subunit
MVTNWGIDIEMIGTKFKIVKGDILLARRNPHLRRVQIAPHSGLFSAHGMVLRSNSEKLLQEYLYVYLTSTDFWQKANRIAVGSLSKTINWKDLAEIEIPLPSLGFQKGVTELFFQTEDAIVKLDALASSLKQLRSGY